MADIEQQGRELPPLPEAYGEITYRRVAGYIGRVEGFTRNQMRDYARAALASQPLNELSGNSGQLPQAPAAAALDLERAIDIMWTWQSALGGHVYDGRDVARTLTAPDMESIGVNPDVLIGVDRREPAIVIAKREIIRALLAAAPAPEVSGG